MNANGLSRRGLLASAGLAIALPSFAAEINQPELTPESADALARLHAGNTRFATGKTIHAHQSADWRRHLVVGQKPFATILGCSDSRVPIELVFDQGFGDLFVVRVAGNVIAPDVLGSLEYAREHLQTRLFVVLGHERCGAVTAALQAMSGPTKELPGIVELVRLIEPGLPRDFSMTSSDQRVSAAVEANVRWSVKQLSQVSGAQDLFAQPITILGAVYDLNTGKVRFL